MADHLMLDDDGFHDTYPSFQGDMYGPYESTNMFPEINNTRIKIMNHLRGQSTINPTLLVEEMLKINCQLARHYEVIDIVTLLRNNIAGKRESEALQAIKTAVGILEKYGRNLLKPLANRPPKWKVIFFSNSVFKSKVGIIEGSKEILQQLGYNLPIPDGLSFPDETDEADENQVIRIVTDLIIAKVEIEKYMNKLHPHPDSMYSILHGSLSEITPSISDLMYGSGLQGNPGGFSTGAPSLATLGSTIYGTAMTSTYNQQMKLPHGSIEDTQEAGSPQKSIALPANPSKEVSPMQVAKPSGSAQALQGASSIQEESIPSGGSDYPSSNSDCNLCGEEKAAIYCTDCKNANCTECDKMWHSHPKRQNHKTEPLILKIDSEVKTQPEPTILGSYSQEIASKVKRPPSTFHEEVVPSMELNIPNDGIATSPMPPHKIERQIQRKSNKSSTGENSRHIQMESVDGNLQAVTKATSMFHHTGTSPKTKKSQKDIDEIKQKLHRDCILILEQVRVIQDKQDLIDDQDCDDYEVLERERDVLLARHKSLRKRIKALEVCVPEKSSKRMSTPQEASIAHSELFKPHALNIKKPPVDDILNISTPGMAPEEVKPGKLDDKIQLESEENYLPKNSKSSDIFGHEASIGIKFPPTVYTPPTLMSNEDVEKLPKTEDAKPIKTISETQPEVHSVLNETLEQGLKKPVLPIPANRTVGWACQYCTFWNTDVSSIICVMCSKTTYRNAASSPLVGSVSGGITHQNSSESGIALQKEELVKKEDEVKLKSVPSDTSKSKETFSQTFPRKTGVTKKNADAGLLVSGLNMTLTDMRTKTRQEEIHQQGQQLVTAIRKAQCNGFDFEKIEMSLGFANQSNLPVDIWLAKNYENFMETAKCIVMNELNTFTPGLAVSDTLLKEVLHKHNGDVERAKKEYLEQFQLEVKKLEDLKLERNGHILTRKEILEELAKSKGDVEQMLVNVQKQTMKKFCDRIWQEDPNMKYSFFDVSEEKKEQKLRCLFAEYNLKSWGRTQNALKLINEKRQDILDDPEYFGDVLSAAREYQSIEKAKNFLSKECSVCFTEFPMTRIVQSMFCQAGNQCKICKECFKLHFTICIKSKSIQDASCPSCNLPDLVNIDKADVSQYFATMDVMLRSHLEADVIDLLHRKLRDWKMSDDDRFRWCTHCRSGFINEMNARKMQCPECKEYTCFNCKQKWEPQHDNISCEMFEQWKRDNDPDLQAVGLARHLQANGIDCPKCKMRYDLAKGGCMHFKCTYCKHEFCSGCRQIMSSDCTRYESCKTKGFHAHHPRDCLFYLRDLAVPELQELLMNHDVAFDIEPKKGEKVVHCQVQEQKETPDGLVDEMCGKKVKDQNAGLCEVHYKEYLVGLINKKHIDPAETFDIDRLHICIVRHEQNVPDRNGESEDDYKQRLLRFVQEEFPIHQ